MRRSRPDTHQTPTIQVIERMFALIDVLASRQEPMSLKEISEQTGLHQSTTHRILNDLTIGRFVDRPEAGSYRLGMRLLELGNLDAQRDWGFAQEYVEGMWRILQANEPDTFVLATGRTVTVREFVRMAFAAAGVTLEFRGKGAAEVAVDAASGTLRVRVNPAFYRPAEVDLLVGDARRAQELLGWSAQTPLEELCRMMVEADLRRNRTGFSF